MRRRIVVGDAFGPPPAEHVATDDNGDCVECGAPVDEHTAIGCPWYALLVPD